MQNPDFTRHHGITARFPLLLPLVVLGFSGSASMAAAETPPTCSLAGLDLNADATYRAALHPEARRHPPRSVSCFLKSQTRLLAGGMSLNISLSELSSGDKDGPWLGASLVTIESFDEKGVHSLGRLVLGPDPLDGSMRFEPQVAMQDGRALVRLSPRHHAIYEINEGTLRSLPAFDWAATLQVFPDAGGGGQPLSIDLEKMEGRIALSRDQSLSDTRPLSTYDRPKVALVRLAYRDGKLAALAPEIVARKTDDDAFVDVINEQEDEARTEIKNRPAGVEACLVSGWSNDPDPSGLNVREAPNAKAKILGIVPPPRKMPKNSALDIAGPVKAEFRIIGHRDGWFLIDTIMAPGVPYDEAYPRSLPQPYKGTGWVAASKVGAAPSNGGLPAGRLYKAPNAEAAYSQIESPEGNLFGPDTPLARVLACSGRWGLVETREGKRGWTRSLCSNQVTNCS